MAQSKTPAHELKPRVLVIERDVDLQKKIAVALEGGYTIDLTSSGALALILMKDYRYACIVASFDLPNRHGGGGILRAVRGMPGGRFVPVIATSTQTWNGSAEDTLQKGFAACLKVPSDIRRLPTLVKDVVEVWD